jgi:penicillin-binding protein 1A
MSLASATAVSVTVVYAQLDLDLGPETVTQTAKAMGITSPLYSYPAEAIGGLTYGVSPLEMANAYATLADGGVRNTPTAIARVEFPNGDVDVPDAGERTRAFPDGVAYEETKVLKGVITGGTGTAANFGCPAAGKTGTTEDNSDAWFVGYTPRLSTAVWVGYPNARISLGSSGFGGTLAAPIWHDFMATAHGSFCEDFPEPENPVQLEPFYGRHTIQRQYRYHYGSPSTSPYSSPMGDRTGDGRPDHYSAPSPTTTTTTPTTPNTPRGPGGTPPGHGGGGVGGGGG